MRSRIIIILIALFAIGFILYMPNLKNALFWDDADWIINNPYVHALTWDNIKFIFSHSALAGIGLKSNYYRPFLFFTFLLNYLTGGLNPIGYHLVNNFIHIGNAFLLFFLLDKFIRKRSVAILASLLFLIHPLQTEAVTYVSGRGDPMSVLFMLLAIVAFLYNWRFSSYILAILAVLSRETAVLFPLYLMVFLVAFVYRERFWSSFKKAFVKALPYLGISLAYGMLRLTALNFINTLNFFQQSNVYTEHLSYRIFTFFHVLAVYFGLIFVPIGLHMERDVLVNTSLFQWPAWLGFLIVIAIMYALAAFYKKERTATINPRSKILNSKQYQNSNFQNISAFRLWFFAWGFFFLNLAPTSGIVPINALIYEHWLYFSLFGFFALLAFYLDAIYNFFKTRVKILAHVGMILLLAYLVFLGVQTVRRNVIWGKTDDFYNNILRYEPQNVRVLNNLAMYYSDHGESKEAEDLYWRATKVGDIQPAPYYNLGNILRDRNDYAGALELYRKAIEVDPYFIYAYMNTAAIYAQQGQLNSALDYLKKLVSIRPTDAIVYFNIGKVDYALGKRNDAIKAMQNAIGHSLDTDNPNVKQQATQFLNSIK